MQEEIIGKTKEYYFNQSDNGEYQWQAFIFKSNDEYFIGIQTHFIKKDGTSKLNQFAKYRDIRYKTINDVKQKLKEKVKLKKEKGYMKESKFKKVEVSAV